MFARLFISAVIFTLMLVAPAGAVVSVGHSGWFWGHPTPQGNHLYAIEFAGATGYAAGNFGTLLRTPDGGDTWTGIRTGTTTDLTRIDVIDGDSVVVAGTCAARRTDDAGESFRRLPFTPSERRCTRRLTDVSFPDANVGYLVLQNGAVLRTSDGGRSFSPRSAVPGTQQAGGASEPTSLLFVSPEVGFATSTQGTVYKTTDEGRTWGQVLGAGSVLNDVFVSGNYVAAVGDSSAFFESENGGATWTTRSGTGPYYSIGMDFTSVRCSGTACLMTSRGGTMARTTDGGKSFLVHGGTANALDFASASRAVAVGTGGSTLVSDDTGRTFTSVSRRLSVARFGRLRATSAAVAHVPGTRGALVRTTNGGQTWTNVGVATSEDVLDSSFPSVQHGYALDVAGGLFRTENGGGSWGILDTGTSSRPRAVLAPDAEVVLLVGPTGIRRSIDSGDSFASVRDSDVRGAALVDVDRAGGSVVAFGGRTIAVSGNRGRTWSLIPAPPGRRVAHADFVSGRRGFALMSNGRVYSTSDRGRRWRESLAVGTAEGKQLAFGDSRNGWLALDGFAQDGAYVLRTSNGGASWRPQPLGVGEVGSIGAGAAAAGFAHLVGPSDVSATGLLATGTGGDAGSPSSLALATSRRRLARPRRVEIRGTLGGARGGEEVVVSVRRRNRSDWTHLLATVARDGSFSVERRITRTSVFVAQWRGDEEKAAAASGALTIRVARRRR